MRADIAQRPRRAFDATIWSATALAAADRGRRTWGYRDMVVAHAVGRAIVRLREDRGWSQYDLAARLGVSQVQVVHYEQGAHAVSVAMLLDLEETFQLRSGHLLDVVAAAAMTAEADFYAGGPLGRAAADLGASLAKCWAPAP